MKSLKVTLCLHLKTKEKQRTGIRICSSNGQAGVFGGLC